MTRCLALLAAVLVPGVVCAQDVAPRWPGLATTQLATVHVLDDTGVETTGRLLGLDADALVLLVDRVERRIDAARVTRIQKRGDSLRNGTLIGAIVGVGMGLLAAGIADCPGDDPGGNCPGVRAAGLLASMGVYTAIGAGIDALVVGRTTLYEAPAARPRAGGMPPPRRAAVNVTVRW